MFRVVIPVLKHTDQTKSLDGLDLKIDYNDCEVFDCIFYSINGIIKIYDDGRYWTEIQSNGTSFISPLETDKIDALIQDQFKLSNFSL